MSTVVDIDFINQESHRLLEFINETADSIAKGYGAGNCTPESVAFWSLYPNTKVTAGRSLLHIELDANNLPDAEIAAAVRKVTDCPEGEIVMFGKTMGKWVLKKF